MTTARGWLYVAALTLSVTIGWPTPAAQASCLRVAPEVVWSYPSANAVDVPIDADVFLILNNSDRPTSIALNGSLVRATGPRQFDPGPLLPLTEYLVTVEAAGPYWAPGDTVT
ncbi:MAG: hypothetical protein KDK70_40935, partial [Myxococcales bacterium]|nr:hypothetical protein [Myxococcales bacterium]